MSDEHMGSPETEGDPCWTRCSWAPGGWGLPRGTSPSLLQAAMHGYITAVCRFWLGCPGPGFQASGSPRSSPGIRGWHTGDELRKPHSDLPFHRGHSLRFYYLTSPPSLGSLDPRPHHPYCSLFVDLLYLCQRKARRSRARRGCLGCSTHCGQEQPWDPGQRRLWDVLWEPGHPAPSRGLPGVPKTCCCPNL